jgi:phasin
MNEMSKPKAGKAPVPPRAPAAEEAKFEAPKFDMPTFEMPKFEMPKFDMPKFDMPKVEVPAAFREMAEKSVAQARDGYEKMKAAAEEATDMLEDSYATASKGATEYTLRALEAARDNANAAFDFASELLAVKSLSDVVELTGTHAQAVRGPVHPGQGAVGARPEGGDRVERAVPERPQQGVQAGGLSGSAGLYEQIPTRLRRSALIRISARPRESGDPDVLLDSRGRGNERSVGQRDWTTL